MIWEERREDDQLFENFLVVSSFLEDLENPTPTIEFEYNKKTDPQIKNMLIESIFGNELINKEIKLTESLSQINELLCANHNLTEQRSNFFVLAAKTPQSYVKPEFFSANVKSVSNPSSLLYWICYKYVDFIGKKKKEDEMFKKRKV